MLDGTFSYQGFGGGIKFVVKVRNNFFIKTAVKIASHTVRLFIAAHTSYSIQPLLFCVALHVQIKRSPPDVLCTASIHFCIIWNKIQLMSLFQFYSYIAGSLHVSGLQAHLQESSHSCSHNHWFSICTALVACSVHTAHLMWQAFFIVKNYRVIQKF